jgi:Recombinase
VAGSPSAPAAANKADQEANARIAALLSAPVIAELKAAGATSLRAIAAGLNKRGIPTARGTGSWSATQVMRVLARC